MSRIALLAAVAFAAVTGTAHAGGWATVEVETPSGLAAGEPWQAELIVKQHGRTPLDGLTPSVEITDASGATRTFDARPAGRPGTYLVDVTYPTAGTWRTRIYDGFTDAVPHRLSPLTVAPASGAGNGFPWPQTVMIAVLALLFLAALAATAGRPRLHAGTFKLRGRAA